jgi:NitT/TauT family transport system permease protein
VSVRQHLATLLVFAALIAAWQLLYLIAGDVALASPVATVRRMVAMLQTRSFWENAGETGYAFFCALALAVAGGVGLGVALGLRRLAAAVAEPILITLYSIPKVTLYPLVLLTFGLGISAKVAFGVMHGLIPIAIFAMNAIRQMKPVYLRSSRVLRLTSLQTATGVVLPAILPELLSGVRIGFSLTLLGVLIGEMFASRHGLGFLITNAMGLGDMATIMAVALFLTAFALMANGVFSSLSRMAHR